MKLVVPLSAAQVKNARPRDKDFELSDGRGLMLRVRKSGSKTWLYKYTKPDGRRSNLALGIYPAVTLSQARKKRDDARNSLDEGIDPKLLRDIKKAELSDTLKKVAAEWMALKKAKVTPDYAEDIWRSLELHVFPDLGDIPIRQVEAQPVIAALKPLAAKGTLETVRRISQRLNEIMTYSVNVGLIKYNPLSGIKAGFCSPDKNNLPTLKPEQLPELMKSVFNSSIRPVTRNLLMFQLHTMTRPSESAGAIWRSEIDLEKKIWTIPPERMKRKREHIIPLTTQTMAILNDMKGIGDEFVFPGDRNKLQAANSATVNMAIKRMGYHGLLVAHGLRSLASTTLNEQGFDPELIEIALSHVDKNTTRSSYNRAEHVEKRREMLQWWSDHIDQALRDGLTSNSTLCH